MRFRRAGRLPRRDQPTEHSAERTIAKLVRKSTAAPADLRPSDLDPLEQELGAGGALEVAAVICCFHAITRMADLIGVELWLEASLLRWRRARSLLLTMQSLLLLCAIDFSTPDVEIDAASELERITDLLGGALPAGWEAALAAPSLAASTRALLSGLGTIDDAALIRIRRAVALSLPSSRAEPPAAEQLPEPLEALSAAATRHARSVPPQLITAVRLAYGWDDAQLTDAFYAIGVANALERCSRLLTGLAAGPELAKLGKAPNRAAAGPG